MCREPSSRTVTLKMMWTMRWSASWDNKPARSQSVSRLDGRTDGLAGWLASAYSPCRSTGWCGCVYVWARHHPGNGRVVLDGRDDLNGKFGLMSETSMKSDTRLRHLGTVHVQSSSARRLHRVEDGRECQKCARWIARRGHRG